MDFRIKLALVAFGGILCFFGFQETRLAAATSAEPQEISAAELAADGYGDNAHVVMSDFVLWDFDFVYEAEESSSAWTRVWVPAVSLDDPAVTKIMVDSTTWADGMMPADYVPVPPEDIRIVVLTDQCSNEQSLLNLGDQDTLTGTVINEIDGLDSEERRLLAQAYPGVDMNSVLILEHKRKPAGIGKLAGFWGGGVLMILAGLALFVIRRG